ncbi:MAG: transglutaminase-like cysteine peptidase [Sulfurimonas sp.]|uniref:transglutaminase-like cysteine peptidase n=1 Tax=Sulfurimonas sp. TaxID=2022749 RepID=UPI00261FF8B1|nr:transglutaminase-like cysteine peptidase [Sulfurimonas sp.]MDD5372882.1 transglutaminase-like cysteine peptidase [Sulfurimonas sp.]
MQKLKVLILLSLFFTNIFFADEPYVSESQLNEIGEKYDMVAKKRFIALQQTLDSVKEKSDLEKLEAVNNFFNEVRYASDMKVYGKKDYWATPCEFLCNDMGDCEDYVISKYCALKYLGVDRKKLFFTYARSTKYNELHMVLTYFETPKSEPLILDNYNRKIFPISERKDLTLVAYFTVIQLETLPKLQIKDSTPIYSFNGDIFDKVGKENEKSHKKWDELRLNIQRKKI